MTGSVPLTAARAPADRLERGRVVGVGFADGHPLELLERRAELFVGDLRRRHQLGQLHVRVLVERFLQPARAGEGVAAQVGGEALDAELQLQGRERGAVLGAGEAAGPRGEGLERADGALAAGGGAGQAGGDRASRPPRPRRRPGRSGRRRRSPARSLRAAGRPRGRRVQDCGPAAPAAPAGPSGRPSASSLEPASRSGATARETWAGPITVCTPGSAAIRRCQRLSAASRAGSVIAPSSAAATITKGAS